MLYDGQPLDPTVHQQQQVGVDYEEQHEIDEEVEDSDCQPQDISTADFIIMQSSFDCEYRFSPFRLSSIIQKIIDLVYYSQFFLIGKQN